MICLKKLLLTASVITIIGGATATGASAFVYCDANAECWHSDAPGRYDPSLGIVTHPDDWYFHQHWDGDRDHRFREYHEGRGYWRDGIWVTL